MAQCTEKWVMSNRQITQSELEGLFVPLLEEGRAKLRNLSGGNDE